MDRFVITNMRVFRVHGILSQRIATMPLSRILDISVHKPVIGRMFGYGHFIFESAAQEQGLREIRYVGDPDARGLTIQRVIQQSGLRGFSAQRPFGDGPPRGAGPAAAAASAPDGWDWLADDTWSRAIPPRPPGPSRRTTPTARIRAPIDLPY